MIRRGPLPQLHGFKLGGSPSPMSLRSLGARGIGSEVASKGCTWFASGVRWTDAATARRRGDSSLSLVFHRSRGFGREQQSDWSANYGAECGRAGDDKKVGAEGWTEWDWRRTKRAHAR
jgi:hypothetical protein